MKGPQERQHAVFLGIHWSWTDIGRSPDAGLDLPFDEALTAKAATALTRFGGSLVADSRSDLVFSLESVRYAIDAVSAINQQCAKECVGRHIALRMGILAMAPTPHGMAEATGEIAGARRLASLASPGQTLVLLPDPAIAEGLGARLTPVDTFDWDDAPDLLDAAVFQVNWQDGVETRVVKVLTPDRQVTRVSKLRLRWRNRHWVMSADSSELSLGRGADMDITIDSEFASRDHARIRPQGTTFVLADVSTNGTYVNLDDSIVFIHDDEVILRGQGWISLGKHASESLGKVLYFSSETSAP